MDKLLVYAVIYINGAYGLQNYFTDFADSKGGFY